MASVKSVRRARRLLILSSLALLFVLGLLGQLLTRPAPSAEIPLTVTLTLSALDNALCDALDADALLATQAADIDGHAVTLLSLSRSPHPMSGFSDGAYLCYPSSLLSDLTLRVRLLGERRGDGYFVGGAYFAVGKRVTLRSPCLSCECEVTAIGESGNG